MMSAITNIFNCRFNVASFARTAVLRGRKLTKRKMSFRVFFLCLKSRYATHTEHTLRKTLPLTSAASRQINDNLRSRSVRLVCGGTRSEQRRNVADLTGKASLITGS